VNHFATNSNAKNSYNSQDELVLKINAAIERLPDKNKTVFMKSRLEEKTHKEIANEMSISVKTVENHITKSLKFLRKQLQEYLK
jgi:RNA polymerase sigma-70 factor, ECF subfamily